MLCLGRCAPGALPSARSRRIFLQALREALRAAIDESELVTKKDLQIELAPIKADLMLLKWMVGALLGLAIANFAKQFF